MDAAQGRLSRPMPDAVPVPDAPRWFSQRCAGLPAAGASPRSLLRRLLLGSYGAFVCGRGDERALDCAPGAARPSGETYSVRTVGRARRRRCLCRRGRLDVVILTAAMSRLLIRYHAQISAKFRKLFLLAFNADFATARARARRTSRRGPPAALLSLNIRGRNKSGPPRSGKSRV